MHGLTLERKGKLGHRRENIACSLRSADGNRRLRAETQRRAHAYSTERIDNAISTINTPGTIGRNRPAAPTTSSTQPATISVRRFIMRSLLMQSDSASIHCAVNKIIDTLAMKLLFPRSVLQGGCRAIVAVSICAGSQPVLKYGRELPWLSAKGADLSRVSTAW